MLDSKPLEFAQERSSNLSTATRSGERYASGLESISFSTSSKSSAPLYYGNDNDVITATDGNQTIYAGDGNNIVLTGSDRDLIYAGSGNDIINLGDGNNIVNAAGGSNRVLTGAGNDLVFVGNGSNAVYTGAGNDIIYAGTGRNLINAGTGNDTVFFGSGVNQLILSGGEGEVTVYGFKASSDRLLGGNIAAQSLKFETEGNDTLVISGSDLLATLKDATVGVKSLVPAGTPLFSYEVVDLGAPTTYPNSTSVAGNVINDRGQIAGRAATGNPSASASPTTPVNVPYIWENGSIKLLTLTGDKIGGPDGGTTVTMPGRGGFINAINNQGMIVGAGDQPYPTGAGDRGLKWTANPDGTYSLTINQYEGVTAGTPIGSSFGTGPYAAESYYFDINNSGQIAGRNIYDGDDHSRAIYLDANGNKFDLPDIGGDTATARGINNLGQIVGLVDGDGELNDINVNTAVVWEQDATGEYILKNLGTFGYDQSSGRDINDVGQIIGTVTSGTGTTAITQAFIYQDGEIALLGGFGGTTESANGINQFGQVVGSAQNVGRQNRAFVWNDGTIFDLNNSVSNPAALSVNGSAVTLTSATGINNFGDIVANGSYTYRDAAGTTQTGTRAYLLRAVV
jgi:probable HAF family extracellular repeat protein